MQDISSGQANTCEEPNKFAALRMQPILVFLVCASHFFRSLNSFFVFFYVSRDHSIMGLYTPPRWALANTFSYTSSAWSDNYIIWSEKNAINQQLNFSFRLNDWFRFLLKYFTLTLDDDFQNQMMKLKRDGKATQGLKWSKTEQKCNCQ